jgi:SPP1 gp7 family putative phage head morphogenesis protein
MEPESRFIASEIVEQLLPMFGKSGVDLVEFDLTKVPILQEAESERWQREYQQIQVGAVLVNEWRESQGREPVKWGDAWWAPLTLAPVKDGSAPTPPAPPADKGEGGEEPPPETEPTNEDGRARHIVPQRVRAIEYGSEEHERLWRRFERREGRWEELLGETAAELFKGQKDSVVARLKASEEEKERRPAGASVQGSNGKGAARSLKDAADEPFDMAEWIRKFREKMRPKIKKVVEDTGQDALDDLKIDLTFNVKQPAVARFIERRAQRFAQEVNETTWNSLRESLGAGLDEGEGLPKLMERVEEVMGERIRSSKEVIARTEVIGAMNGGTLEAWKQSEVVGGKEWLAELDDRVRDSHREAHGQVVGLDEDFQVGGGSGPHPGAIGLAEEDINCRCSMVAVLKEEGQV